jgi:Glu-tRNA(Gln) amidotransferase subunit E-like FAD-binding protein
MTSSRYHQPWITTETKRLCRKKKRWFQKAKASKCKKVWKKYRKIKNLAQRTCRQTHAQYVNDIFVNLEENSKPRKTLWTYIKSLRQDSIGIGDLKGNNNIPISDPIKKASLIHEQFDSVFSNPHPPSLQTLMPTKDSLTCPLLQFLGTASSNFC